MIIPLREALELEISIRQGLWRHAVDKAFIKMSYFKRQSPSSRKCLALKVQCSTRTKFEQKRKEKINVLKEERQMILTDKENG